MVCVSIKCTIVHREGKEEAITSSLFLLLSCSCPGATTCSSLLPDHSSWRPDDNNCYSLTQLPWDECDYCSSGDFLWWCRKLRGIPVVHQRWEKSITRRRNLVARQSASQTIQRGKEEVLLFWSSGQEIHNSVEFPFIAMIIIKS